MSDRYDSLAPKDLMITLRSLRRRFAGAVGPVQSDPDLFARVDEPGPDGRSLRAIVATAAAYTESLGGAVRTVATTQSPVIDGSVFEPDPDLRLPLEHGVGRLADAADATAALLDRQPTEGWAWTASIRNGSYHGATTIDLVTLTREMVRQAIENLRATERHVVWLQD